MSRKLFYNMNVKVIRGEVHLSFFKSTPLFSSKLEADRFPVIRIYRKEEPEFTFNDDYEEYFDGIDVREAELLFEGQLEAYNDRKYTFIDANVRIGSNYAYWVSSNRGDPPIGPASVRVRDERVWWPPEETDRRMERLTELYPEQVSLRSFGHTIRGRPIRGLVIGNPHNSAVFIGLIHPGESGPELIIPAVEHILAQHRGLLDRAGVVIVPAVNIDQRERLVQGHPGYLRTNFNGVDVNRNFPGDWVVDYNYGLVTSDPQAITYRGTEPASEPETRAVIACIEQTNPRCVFSFHWLASICGPHFLTTKSGRDDAAFKASCLRYASAYHHGFYGGDDRDREVQLHFASSSGGLANWLYTQKSIPGFDLEGGSDPRSRLAQNDRTTIELLEEYQQRHGRAMAELLQLMGSDPHV